MKKKEIKFLEWLYNRLVHVYEENENEPFMANLRNIIQSLKEQLKK